MVLTRCSVEAERGARRCQVDLSGFTHAFIDVLTAPSGKKWHLVLDSEERLGYYYVDGLREQVAAHVPKYIPIAPGTGLSLLKSEIMRKLQHEGLQVEVVQHDANSLLISWDEVSQIQLAKIVGNIIQQCGVCLSEGAPMVALVPCGHLICGSCGELCSSCGYRRCPFCRRDVTGIQTLFAA